MATFECPTCHKEWTVARREDAPYRPFCCERCKLVDLGKWLDGTYAIHEPLPSSDSTPAAEDAERPEPT